MQSVILQHMDHSQQLNPLLGQRTVIVLGDEIILLFKVRQPTLHLEFFVAVFRNQETLNLEPFPFVELNGRWVVVVGFKQFG